MLFLFVLSFLPPRAYNVRFFSRAKGHGYTGWGRRRRRRSGNARCARVHRPAQAAEHAAAADMTQRRAGGVQLPAGGRVARRGWQGRFARAARRGSALPRAPPREYNAPVNGFRERRRGRSRERGHPLEGSIRQKSAVRVHSAANEWMSGDNDLLIAGGGSGIGDDGLFVRFPTTITD